MPYFYSEEGHPTDELHVDWDPADGQLFVDVRVGIAPVELKVLMDGAVLVHAECGPGWSQRFAPRSILILRASDAAQVSYMLSNESYWSPIGEEPGRPHSIAIHL